MLSSLYDDTSSETSQVNTPKRRNNSAMRTPRAHGTSAHKIPFKSPYLTPLRSTAKKNPIVQQVQSTMDLCIRIFTSNILFVSTMILCPIFLILLFTKGHPYWNPPNCDFTKQERVRYYCVDIGNKTIYISKTVTNIVKEKKPKTFEELYNLVIKKEEITRELLLQSLNLTDEVAYFNGNIYYKLSDSAEISILFLLSVISLGLFITCCFFKYRRHFSYEK